MATEKSRLPNDDVSPTDDRYTGCLLKPMGRNGDPTLQASHVIDAVLVGVLAFATVVLVDVLPALVSGSPIFLTPKQIIARSPTAGIAFLLAFAFQWARARGIDALAAVRTLLGE